jgi:hypothetical protein
VELALAKPGCAALTLIGVPGGTLSNVYTPLAFVIVLPPLKLTVAPAKPVAVSSLTICPVMVPAVPPVVPPPPEEPDVPPLLPPPELEVEVRTKF